MRLPFQMLSRVGTKFNVLISQIADKSIQLQQIEEFTHRADIISLQAPGHHEAAYLIRLFKSKGKKVVVDYDDYSFDLSPTNPRYAELGTRECELLGKDGKPLYRWKNGENGFDLQSNIDRYNGFIECVKEADMVSVTTDYLASKFLPLNKNTVVLPNSIDMSLWKSVPKGKGMEGEIRIGWFGGDSHFSDLWIFRRVIPRILKKYPAVKIVIQAPMVDFWLEAFKDIPAERVEWYSWTDLKFYTLFLASRGFDIGMCPLEPDNEFNKCKSGIKQFEFAAFGVPSVCQNMLPYSEVVKDGHNGFLASTEQEWEEKLSCLIEDASLRKRVGDNAFSEVNTKWNLEKNCLLWEQAYSSLLEGQNASQAGRVGVGNCS